MYLLRSVDIEVIRIEEINGVYINKCYRKSGPCLFGEEKRASKESYFDYYDTSQKAYIRLDCKIHQKYQTPTLLEIEEAEKFHSPTGNSTYETPDLQLADYNGKWMTRSDDPEVYPHKLYEFETKNCSICDIVCDIRDEEKYLNEDGSCPFPSDTMPDPIYWKVADQKTTACKDYLSPVMLLNLDSVNRKRRRKTYNFLKGYLQEKKWLDLHIQSQRKIVDVWEKHYQPLQFYLPSMEALWLYVKNVPKRKRTEQFVSHIVHNVENWCVNFEELLKKEWERKMWEKVIKSG